MRGKREEGRGKKEEGRGKKEEGRGGEYAAPASTMLCCSNLYYRLFVSLSTATCCALPRTLPRRSFFLPASLSLSLSLSLFLSPPPPLSQRGQVYGTEASVRKMRMPTRRASPSAAPAKSSDMSSVFVCVWGGVGPGEEGVDEAVGLMPLL
jgi:hypothetical protein